MRIKELNEGFTSGFKAGYGSSSLSKPAKEPKKSPLNLIGDRDLKQILAAILRGEQLSNYQLAQLQRVYNGL